MVRREAMDLAKLMVPTLQQRLYSELHKKLIEVSEVGTPAHMRTFMRAHAAACIFSDPFARTCAGMCTVCLGGGSAL
jgi:hypothetical protein